MGGTVLIGRTSNHDHLDPNFFISGTEIKYWLAC